MGLLLVPRGPAGAGVASAEKQDLTQIMVWGIAQDLRLGTDVGVTTYNEHLKGQHALAQLHRTPTIHPDAATVRRITAPGKPILFAIPQLPPRPRPELVCAQPRVDSKRRIGLTRVAAGCEWSVATELWARIEGGRVRLDAQVSDHAIRVRVDAQGRITLTPALCVALGVESGDVVQVVADRATKEATLISVARVLELVMDGGAGDD